MWSLGVAGFARVGVREVEAGAVGGEVEGNAGIGGIGRVRVGRLIERAEEMGREGVLCKCYFDLS
jgi:hypothetical protein